MRRWLVVGAAVLAAACGAGPTGAVRPVPSGGPPAPGAALPRASTLPAVGSSVWSIVSVGTLWTSPSAPRPVDAKALTVPVDIRGWLAAMSTTARRGLVGRVETQVLYGERMLVTRTSGSWLRVVAVNQKTHRDTRGYPGWIPARQVTTRAPVITSTVATVVRLTAWLRTATVARWLEVSLGTRLPVLGRTATTVTVATPRHGRAYIAASAVVVRSRASAALTGTRADVVSFARRFIGVPYLWGGRSGYAVDCSGFTQLVYKVFGVVIPRDADDQARAGRAVSLSALRRADLLFYRVGSTIGHVAFYIGYGQRLHAPGTGLTVRISGMGTPTLARRYL